MISKIW